VFACGVCFIGSPHKHTPNKTGPCPFLHIPASLRPSAARDPESYSELNHELERPAAQSGRAVALLQLFHLRLHGALRLYDQIQTSARDACVVVLGSPTAVRASSSPPGCICSSLPPRATSLLQHPPVPLLKFLRRRVVVHSFLFAPSFCNSRSLLLLSQSSEPLPEPHSARFCPPPFFPTADSSPLSNCPVQRQGPFVHVPFHTWLDLGHRVKKTPGSPQLRLPSLTDKAPASNDLVGIASPTSQPSKKSFLIFSKGWAFILHGSTVQDHS
jgi:hypothetical protein